MTFPSKSRKLEQDPEYKSLLEFIDVRDFKKKDVFRVRKRTLNRKYKNIFFQLLTLGF